MERTAAEAERASVKYKQVEFMKDKIGQEFDGVISGVTEWGIYVEIIDNRCEGMIRSRDLKGDHFIFDEDNYRYVGKNSNKIYALGDTVKIIVMDADLVKKQLNFALADMQDKSNKGFRNDDSFGGQGNNNFRGGQSGQSGKSGSRRGGSSRGGNPKSGGKSESSRGGKGQGEKNKKRKP